MILDQGFLSRRDCQLNSPDNSLGWQVKLIGQIEQQFPVILQADHPLSV